MSDTCCMLTVSMLVAVGDDNDPGDIPDIIGDAIDDALRDVDCDIIPPSEIRIVGPMPVAEVRR